MNVLRQSTDFVTRLTARVLVGAPLCRSKEWLQISQSYTSTLIALCRSLRAWPSAILRIVAPHLSSKKRLDRYHAGLHRMLGPLIDHRRDAKRSDSLPTVLEMLVDRTQASGANHKRLILQLMMLNPAATSTSVLALANALIDLCANPEYIIILRNELVEKAREDDNQLNMSTMRKLWKLDSFMKESQRVNQPGLCERRSHQATI